MDKNKIKKYVNENQTNLILIEKELGDNGNGGGGNGDYWPKFTTAEKNAVYKMPWHEGYNIHFMGLPGFIYRNLKDDRKATIDLVYEIVRLARVAGARYIRTFLMNGSRKASERYMADALPWITTGGDIDFNKRNDYYYDCMQVIEKACKTWHCIHRPTYWMKRYNQDIFNRDNNKQGIHGFRSEGAQKVKVKFMVDYTNFQKIDMKNNSTPTFEPENETKHTSRVDGLNIATHIKEQYEAIKALGYGIQYKHLMTCSGMSEFSHANFVGPSWLMIQGKKVWFGDPAVKKRYVIAERHGVSTLDALMNAEFMTIVKNFYWMRPAYNGDGSTDGNYNPLPGSKHKQGDYDDLAEMFHFAIPACKRKGKIFVFTAFAMDCLSVDPTDNILKETYDLNRMDFGKHGRYSAYADTMHDLGY